MRGGLFKGSKQGLGKWGHEIKRRMSGGVATEIIKAFPNKAPLWWAENT